MTDLYYKRYDAITRCIDAMLEGSGRGDCIYLAAFESLAPNIIYLFVDVLMKEFDIDIRNTYHINFFKMATNRSITFCGVNFKVVNIRTLNQLQTFNRQICHFETDADLTELENINILAIEEYFEGLVNCQTTESLQVSTTACPLPQSAYTQKTLKWVKQNSQHARTRFFPLPTLKSQSAGILQANIP